MKKLWLVAASAVAVSVACSQSPHDLCHEGLELTCTKVHECTPAAQKDEGTCSSVYGSNAAECEAKFDAIAKCEDKKTENDLCQKLLPDGGTQTGTYSVSKAEECAEAVKAQSCADYNDANKVPDA